MALGQKIRALRDELGMSQAQLATQGGLSQGYLSQLENDEVQHPSAAVIFGLAKALYVDPRVLMQAAGYSDTSAAGGDAGYEVEVDPDLLQFLARMPRENQGHLLKMMQSMEAGRVRLRPASARKAPAGKRQVA